MRIAYLNPSGHLGGAEACLLDMVAVVRASRPQWQVLILLGEAGPLQKRLEALGAKVKVLPFPLTIARVGDSAISSRAELLWMLVRSTLQVVAYRRYLKQILQQFEPDIIHTNGFKMHVFGALAKMPSSRLFWHVHDYVSCRPLLRRVLQRLSHKVETVITNSQSVATDVRRSLAPCEIVPILNVVSKDEFCPEGPQLPMNAPPGVVRVGLVATMAWWKGHRLFLDAIAKLDRSIPVHGVIVGGAVYKTASRQETIEGLCAYAKKLGIADRVSFIGFVSEPATAMRSLDIVVHASTEPEPFGRVIVEAMSCGKPVISSGTGGASEILFLGEFAKTFISNDADSLASAIAELASDAQTRTRLGQNGIQIARAYFSRDRLGSELLPLYGGQFSASLAGNEIEHPEEVLC